MKKTIVLLKSALMVSILLTISACGSATQSTSSKVMVIETTAASMDMAQAHPGAAPISPEEAGVAPGSESTGLTSNTESPQVLPSNRKLIRNTNMEVETEQFDSFLSTLITQISTLGGYVENSSVSGNSIRNNEPIPRYASITARIPHNHMDGFITTIESAGNVINKSESISDVTLQYNDMESRKKTLSVEQDRIWALLEKAESIETVIVLEQRLSEIRYELESMESQLRLYDNQVDYSTVYLNINEVTSLTPTQPESSGERMQKGFTDNLKAVSRGLTTFVIWLITFSPIWIPLVIIAFLVWYFTRHHKHKLADTDKKQVDTADDIQKPTE